MHCFALTMLLMGSLFDRMAGQWVAQGVRHQNFSGRDTAILSETVSTIQAEALISKSTTRETDARSGELVREYDLAYWMRPGDDSSRVGEFLLGPGTDPSGPPRAHARFDGSTLTVIQELGGDFRIRSETMFGDDPELIRYLETTLHGETVLSETRLEYHRKN